MSKSFFLEVQGDGCEFIPSSVYNICYKTCLSGVDERSSREMGTVNINIIGPKAFLSSENCSDTRF